MRPAYSLALFLVLSSAALAAIFKTADAIDPLKARTDTELCEELREELVLQSHEGMISAQEIDPIVARCVRLYLDEQ